jgi:hypothetical protein
MLETLHLPTQIAPLAHRSGPQSPKSSLQRPHANKQVPYPKSLSSTQVFLSRCRHPPLLQPFPLRNFHPQAHSFPCNWASLCTPRETWHEPSHLPLPPLFSSRTTAVCVWFCCVFNTSPPCNTHPSCLTSLCPRSRLESRVKRGGEATFPPEFTGSMSAARVGATLLLSILLSALTMTGGDLLGPGLAQPSLPVRLPSSVAELEGRIPGWADWREIQKNMRALRRTHGYAGTYPNIGVRPEVEPEISEDEDGIEGGRGQGMADDEKLPFGENDLEREVWRAAKQGDVASLSVRSKKIAYRGDSPALISFL